MRERNRAPGRFSCLGNPSLLRLRRLAQAAEIPRRIRPQSFRSGGTRSGARSTIAEMTAPKLFDVVLHPSTARVTAEPFGDHVLYFEGPTNELSLMVAGSVRLKPGASPHPPHRHPEEEFLLVTEGTGEIFVDGKTVQAGPGSMMYCQGNDLHGIQNTGSEPMLFYYYKWLS